jgi:hypothetical protein
VEQIGAFTGYCESRKIPAPTMTPPPMAFDHLVEDAGDCAKIEV